jgi:hypothetical protein
MDDKKELLKAITELTADNHELEDELLELRPLARLAVVISMMEGQNKKLHKDLLRARRDADEADLRYHQTKIRLEGAEALLAQFEAKIG